MFKDFRTEWKLFGAIFLVSIILAGIFFGLQPNKDILSIIVFIIAAVFVAIFLLSVAMGGARRKSTSPEEILRQMQDPRVIKLNKRFVFFWRLKIIPMFILFVVLVIVSFYGVWRKSAELQQISSQQQVQQTKIDTSDWKTYINEEFGFEVKYPSSLFMDVQENVVRFSDSSAFNEQQDAMVIDFVSSSRESIWWYPKEENWRDTEPFASFVRLIQMNTNQEAQGIFSGDPPWGYYYMFIPFLPQSTQGMEISARIFRDDEPPFGNYSDRDTFLEILSTFRFVEPIDTSDWQTYRNEEFGFEVKYPSVYDTEQKYERGKCSPGTYRSEEDFSLFVGPLSINIKDAQRVTLSEFVDEVEKGIKPDLEKGISISRVLSREKTTLADEEAIRLATEFCGAGCGQPIMIYVKRGEDIYQFLYDDGTLSGCLYEPAQLPSQAAEEILSTFRFVE